MRPRTRLAIGCLGLALALRAATAAAQAPAPLPADRIAKAAIVP